jgi:hypothetical protein
MKSMVLSVLLLVGSLAYSKPASIKFNIGLEHPQGKMASDVFILPSGETNTFPLGDCKISLQAVPENVNILKVTVDVLEGSGPAPKSLGKNELKALWGRSTDLLVTDKEGRFLYRLWVLPQQNML